MCHFYELRRGETCHILLAGAAQQPRRLKSGYQERTAPKQKTYITSGGLKGPIEDGV